MRTATDRLSAAVSAGVITALLSVVPLASPPAQAQAAIATNSPTDSALECGTAEVTRTLPTGSAWRMCVRVHDFKGLVAESIQFKPATGTREYEGWLPVIDSITLAQLHVPYDHGRVGFNDVTGTGMGGPQLIVQNDDTCVGTTMPVDQSLVTGSNHYVRTIPGICVAVVSTGLAWQAQDFAGINSDRYASQGSALELSSIARVGWYEYQQRYTFTDQGEISLTLGATGDVGQSDLYFPTDPALGWNISPGDPEAPTQPGAASHWHNAIYRVDFGIDAGEQQVERWDYAKATETGYRIDGTPTAEGRAFIAPADGPRHTWWRVLNPTSLNKDGHPRSYEIVNDTVQDTFWEQSSFKVAFTNDNPCQEYAWDNLNIGCPGQTINNYVNGDTDPLTDPVAWINSGFHHIVRNEDQSPMPIHWQEVSLVPRDLLAQQATTPPERSCINGGPINPSYSCAAVNTARPSLTASAGTLRPGVVLTSTPGTWKTARALLRFQRLWLRDGQPITITGPDGLPATVTSDSYTLTPADQGHEITVDVLASAPGIIPGSARSLGLAIPPAPRAAPTPRATPSPPRAAPRIRVKLRRSAARAVLKISATGKHGPATGKVTVIVRKWSRTQVLRRGRATITVPARTLKRPVRVTVRYGGSPTYAELQRSWKVRKSPL